MSGKLSHVHGLEELKLLKMCVLAKVVYKFSVIPIDILMVFFTEVEKKS